MEKEMMRTRKVMDMMTKVLNDHKEDICNELAIECDIIGFDCTQTKSLAETIFETKIDELLFIKQVTVGAFKEVIVYTEAIKTQLDMLGADKKDNTLYSICLYVIAHELRHVFQIKYAKHTVTKAIEDRLNGFFSLGLEGYGDDPMEKDANNYAKDYTKRRGTKLNYEMANLITILQEDAGRFQPRVLKQYIAYSKVQFLKMLSK